MNIAKKSVEIAVGPLVCKKHTTAYDDEIEGLGRAGFFGDGLKLINQRIGPYNFQSAGHIIANQKEPSHLETATSFTINSSRSLLRSKPEDDRR